MSIESHIQQSSLGPFIELYELETDGNIYYFTPNNNGGANLQWNGNTYTPLPVELRDVRQSGDEPARPVLALSNVNKFLLAGIIAGDIIGSTLTRRRTFQQLLNDPGEQLATDTYFVMQILSMSKLLVELQLGSPVDKNNIKLPRKLVLPDDYPGIKNLSL